MSTYDIAASDQHADAVRWTFDATMCRSVANRAGRVELPESFSQDLIAEEVQHSAEVCAHGHRTPVEEPAEWSRSMRPEPPRLTKAATDWTPAENRWIITNGIKMIGMPTLARITLPRKSWHWRRSQKVSLG